MIDKFESFRKRETPSELDLLFEKKKLQKNGTPEGLVEAWNTRGRGRAEEPHANPQGTPNQGPSSSSNGGESQAGSSPQIISPINVRVADTFAQMGRDIEEISPARTYKPIEGKVGTRVKAIKNNALTEAKGLYPYLAPDVSVLLKDHINIITDIIKDPAFADVDATSMDGMIRDSIDKMVFQEIEANRKSFTDHGVRDIVGNIVRQEGISTAMNKGVPLGPREQLMASIIMVNHDLGYTSPEVRANTPDAGKNTAGHGLRSREMFESQRAAYSQIFSTKELDQMGEIIATHDSPELDKNDPLGSSIRLSDNLAMFSEEKLPGLFSYVPGGKDILTEMGKAVQDKAHPDLPKLEELRKKLWNQIDGSNLNENLKRDLKSGTQTVDQLTPHFSMGTLAGDIEEISHNEDTDETDVTIRYNEFDETLQNLFQMGQKQTNEMLTHYGHSNFSETEYDLGGIARLKVIGYHKGDKKSSIQKSGTSEGAIAGWNTRGRGRKEEEKSIKTHIARYTAPGGLKNDYVIRDDDYYNKDIPTADINVGDVVYHGMVTRNIPRILNGKTEDNSTFGLYVTNNVDRATVYASSQSLETADRFKNLEEGAAIAVLRAGNSAKWSIRPNKAKTLDSVEATLQKWDVEKIIVNPMDYWMANNTLKDLVSKYPDKIELTRPFPEKPSQLQKFGTSEGVERSWLVRDRGKGGKEESSFKAWFGDSKVVDKKGNPLTVYHGTSHPGMTTFQIDPLRPDYKNETSSMGAWFTNSPKVASTFAQSNKFGDEDKTVGGVYPVHLSLKNPKVYEPKPDSQVIDPKTGKPQFYQERKLAGINPNSYEAEYKNVDTDRPVMQSNDPFEQMMDDRDEFATYIGNVDKPFRGYWRKSMMALHAPETNKKFTDSLKSQGYDGIIIQNTEYDAPSKKNPINQYVVFDPSQVKSTFNVYPTTDPDIRKEVVGIIIRKYGTPEGVTRSWDTRGRRRNGVPKSSTDEWKPTIPSKGLDVFGQYPRSVPTQTWVEWETHLRNDVFTPEQTDLMDTWTDARKDLTKNDPLIQDMMSNAKIPFDVVMWHGMTPTELDRLNIGITKADIKQNIGKTFTYDKYMSTSASLDWANNFTRCGKGAVFEINVPKGTSAFYMHENKKLKINERELLINKNTKFRIKSVTSGMEKPFVIVDIINDEIKKFGTSEGVTRSWDTRGRGRKPPLKSEMARGTGEIASGPTGTFPKFAAPSLKAYSPKLLRNVIVKTRGMPLDESGDFYVDAKGNINIVFNKDLDKDEYFAKAVKHFQDQGDGEYTVANKNASDNREKFNKFTADHEMGHLKMVLYRSAFYKDEFGRPITNQKEKEEKLRRDFQLDPDYLFNLANGDSEWQGLCQEAAKTGAISPYARHNFAEAFSEYHSAYMNNIPIPDRIRDYMKKVDTTLEKEEEK